MPVADHALLIACDPSPGHQRLAAGIWARATARRDGLAVAATVEEKLPGIRDSLLRDGASLHVASRSGDAVGFALAVPHAGFLELLYLAVDPSSWGFGVGACLLDHLDDHARSTGYDELELWVIADNDRALGLYERSGWQATDEIAVRSSAGRPERRLVRRLGGRT